MGAVIRSPIPERVEMAGLDPKSGMTLCYPTMGRVPDVLAAIEKTGFSLEGHFTLPDEAWWDDFYAPMESRIEELRGKYADDAEALDALDQLAQEPEMHRRHSSYYAYDRSFRDRLAVSRETPVNQIG